MATLILAGLSTPLVLSVHTVVSFDFAVSLIPGWHATIFPPYFVAGAIYAGFAMVLTLAIPVRRFYGMESLITMRHIDNMAKITLATGLIVGYGYAMEAFFAWYSGSPHERFMMWNRMFGPYGWSYWTLIAINGVMIQLLWSKKIRQNNTVLFVMSLLIGVGMWLERFVIIVTSLNRDFIPASWGMYYPTQLGLHDVLRNDRVVPDAVPVVPAVRADDRDLRGQDAAAAVEGEDMTTHTNEPTNRLHGVMAEFDSAQDVLDAARKTMAQGFTKLEAYSPGADRRTERRHPQEADQAVADRAGRRPDRHGDRLRPAGTGRR